MTDASTSTSTLRPWEAPTIEGGSDYARRWDGWLTLDNLDAVATRIKQLIGDTSYTFVAANGLFGFVPEVRTSLRVERAVDVYRAEDSTYAGITWSDGSYAMGLHTTVQTQEQARALAEDESTRKRLTRVTLEPTFRGRDQMQVWQHSGAGHDIYWIFAVEHNNHDFEDFWLGGARTDDVIIDKMGRLYQRTDHGSWQPLDGSYGSVGLDAAEGPFALIARGGKAVRR